MAKRRAAEPLTFHVPWKRLLLCDFTEEPPPPPLWVSPASHPGQPLGVPELPRKRKIDAGAMAEPSASPSKRHDGGDTNAPGGVEHDDLGFDTGELPRLQPPLQPREPGEELRGALPPRGGGDNGAGRAEPGQGDWEAVSCQRETETKIEMLMEEASTGIASSTCPNQGPSPQPRYMPSPVIKLRPPGSQSGAQPLSQTWLGSGFNEEFWQYNTFQYWRNPLPPIDLADIEDVNEDNVTEAGLQNKNEVVEIDMES